MCFRIISLPREPFEPLFALDAAALRRHRACRVTADKERAFPCRVSLRDAAVGEELILVHHEHLPEESPFRASHAVYVRIRAERRHLAPGEIPGLFRTRMLSLRAFDRDHMMQAATLVDGREAESGIDALLADSAVAYLHVHYAAPGCFAARIERN